jgi:glycosyltransferase involved in cell wall biosynthesis
VEPPEVSFAITNLNGARQLERTLSRLIEVVGVPTFREKYELVVADAGSRDDSLAVLDGFRRSYGHTIVHSEPCSRGRGRQRAFELSHGRHVAVLDSDTYVRPYYGAFLRGYLAFAAREPSAVLAYEEMDGRHANMTCAVYPREVLARVGGWRDLWGAEDIDLWVRLVRTDRLRFLPACLGDDLDHVLHPSAPTPEDHRTVREQRYGRGVAFYRRWLRQTYGRYVGFAYSFPEKIRYEWARQPRWPNRLLDLVGSALARVRFYLGHPPVVRLDPARHNGYALTRHLFDHMVMPSDFGLDDGIMELRTNRMVREFVADRALSERALAVYAELAGRGRVVDAGD